MRLADSLAQGAAGLARIVRTKWDSPPHLYHSLGSIQETTPLRDLPLSVFLREVADACRSSWSRTRARALRLSTNVDPPRAFTANLTRAETKLSLLGEECLPVYTLSDPQPSHVALDQIEQGSLLVISKCDSANWLTVAVFLSTCHLETSIWLPVEKDANFLIELGKRVDVTALSVKALSMFMIETCVSNVKLDSSVARLLSTWRRPPPRQGLTARQQSILASSDLQESLRSQIERTLTDSSLACLAEAPFGDCLKFTATLLACLAEEHRVVCTLGRDEWLTPMIDRVLSSTDAKILLLDSPWSETDVIDGDALIELHASATPSRKKLWQSILKKFPKAAPPPAMMTDVICDWLEIRRLPGRNQSTRYLDAEAKPFSLGQKVRAVPPLTLPTEVENAWSLTLESRWSLLRLWMEELEAKRLSSSTREEAARKVEAARVIFVTQPHATFWLGWLSRVDRLSYSVLICGGDAWQGNEMCCLLAASQKAQRFIWSGRFGSPGTMSRMPLLMQAKAAGCFYTAQRHKVLNDIYRLSRATVTHRDAILEPSLLRSDQGDREMPSFLLGHATFDDKTLFDFVLDFAKSVALEGESIGAVVPALPSLEQAERLGVHFLSFYDFSTIKPSFDHLFVFANDVLAGYVAQDLDTASGNWLRRSSLSARLTFYLFVPDAGFVVPEYFRQYRYIAANRDRPLTVLALAKPLAASIKIAQSHTQPCGARLDCCSHECQATREECHAGRLHKLCQVPCSDKISVCNHLCASNCHPGSCPPCTKPCIWGCKHRLCSHLCGQACEPCLEPCGWECAHKRCTRLCSEPCDRTICTEPCPEKLPCGHPCMGFCGEVCPKGCHECNTAEAICNLEADRRLLLFEDCGHEADYDVLKWFTESPSASPRCPICRTIALRTPCLHTMIIGVRQKHEAERTRIREAYAMRLKDPGILPHEIVERLRRVERLRDALCEANGSPIVESDLELVEAMYKNLSRFSKIQKYLAEQPPSSLERHVELRCQAVVKWLPTFAGQPQQCRDLFSEVRALRDVTKQLIARREHPMNKKEEDDICAFFEAQTHWSDKESDRLKGISSASKTHVRARRPASNIRNRT